MVHNNIGKVRQTPRTYTLQYGNTSFNFTIIHLTGSVHFWGLYFQVWVHAGSRRYWYKGSAFNFILVHLAASVRFWGLYFQVWIKIQWAQVSIGTRAQRVIRAQVNSSSWTQRVIRAQVNSFAQAQRFMRALVFIFIYSDSAGSVNLW